MFQKEGLYRNRKLLDLAHKVEYCQIQIPGVCTGYTGGCEPAHSNEYRHGKGKGMKSHDVFHGAGCRACHYEIDNGKLLSKDDRRHYM